MRPTAGTAGVTGRLPVWHGHWPTKDYKDWARAAARVLR